MIRYFFLLILLPVNLMAWDQLGTPLEDSAQEERAKNLFTQLRCMVCDGESINDSNAPMALDMRYSVRQQIHSGKSNEEILNFFQTRYGETILMEPRLELHTAPLWVAPFLFLLIGGIILWRFFL